MIEFLFCLLHSPKWECIPMGHPRKASGDRVAPPTIINYVTFVYGWVVGVNVGSGINRPSICSLFIRPSISTLFIYLWLIYNAIPL